MAAGFGVAGVLASTVPSTAAGAWTHNSANCHFSSRNIQYIDGTGGLFSEANFQAAQNWTQKTVVNLTQTTTGSMAMRITAANHGNTNWNGIAYYGPCQNNH